MAHPRPVLDPDPRVRARQLARAHDDFLADLDVLDPDDPALAPVRGLVLDSWRRSLRGGLDPESCLAPVALDPATLARLRAGHPLAAAMPVVRRLLVESATDAGLLVAVSDAAGRLLWVEGNADLRARAEGMHFVEGASWREADVGTNAPGTALALDRPVAIHGAEHLSRTVTPWSCSAAPIHDPDTGAVLGVLDLTGGDEVASAQSLTLVRATVAAVEAELQVARLTGRVPRDADGSTGRAPRRRARAVVHPRLDVLGVHGATVTQADSTVRLGARHSEILLLVASSTDGCTADELATGLSEGELSSVAVRAELSRVRPLLAELGMTSRPYRFAAGLDTDVAVVSRHLDRGRLRQAVAAYRGPVLPWSDAPAVVALREDLHHRLRRALMGAGEPDAILAFADTAYGRDDVQMWQAALDSLDPGSPRRVAVTEHVDALLRQLA